MNLGIEVDLEHLANLLAVGHVLQYNKSSDREYCGLVKGRPWHYRRRDTAEEMMEMMRRDRSEVP